MTEIVVTAGASPGIVLGTGPTEPRVFPLLFGASGLTPTTTTRYLFPGFADSHASTIPICRPAPYDGVLSRLRVLHTAPGGNGGIITYTVRINGAATLLAVSMASTDSVGVNLTTTVAVSAGDLVDIEVTKAINTQGSPTDIIAGLVFVL